MPECSQSDNGGDQLKSIYNLRDEGVVTCWPENPYMQYFTGEVVFQKFALMNPIEMA